MEPPREERFIRESQQESRYQERIHQVQQQYSKASSLQEWLMLMKSLTLWHAASLICVHTSAYAGNQDRRCMSNDEDYTRSTGQHASWIERWTIWTLCGLQEDKESTIHTSIESHLRNVRGSPTRMVQETLNVIGSRRNQVQSIHQSMWCHKHQRKGFQHTLLFHMGDLKSSQHKDSRVNDEFETWS